MSGFKEKMTAAALALGISSGIGALASHSDSNNQVEYSPQPEYVQVIDTPENQNIFDNIDLNPRDNLVPIDQGINNANFQAVDLNAWNDDENSLVNDVKGLIDAADAFASACKERDDREREGEEATVAKAQPTTSLCPPSPGDDEGILNENTPSEGDDSEWESVESVDDLTAPQVDVSDSSEDIVSDNTHIE